MQFVMEYAVIKTGGKQYRVSPGDVIEVEKLIAKAGDVVTFSDVLMLKSNDDVKLGGPLITGLSVSGKVLDQFKHDKIRVSQYKAKVRHRRTIGHRQHLTRVQIEAIGKENKAKTDTKTEKTPVKRAATRKIADKAA